MDLFNPGYIKRVLKVTKIQTDVIKKPRQFLYDDLKGNSYI